MNAHRTLVAIAMALALALAAPGQGRAAALPDRPGEGVAASPTSGAELPVLKLAAPDATWQPGLDNPRSAAYGFIVTTRSGDFAGATGYLDLSRLPEAERAERGPLLARELKVVLDQKLWLDFEKISDRPDGETDDGLAENLERLGTIPTSKGSMDIVLKRSPGANGKLEWRFGPGTLERLEILSEEYGYGALGEWLPTWATRMRFWYLEGWQWIGLVLTLLTSIPLSVAITRSLYWVVRRFTPRTEPGFRDPLLETVRTPARLTVTLVLIGAGVHFLRLSLPARHLYWRAAVEIAIVLAAWALVKLTDHFSVEVLERLAQQDRRGSVATIVLLRRLVKAAVLVVAGMAALQVLGFNVTAAIAGLGIGGIAVALAAQKTLENLLGGVMLTTDQPIRIGDFCRFGDKEGVVESIGLRSTQIRTLDRTVVTVPNAELSSIQIENFALRDRIRILTVLGLRYETTPAQLRWLLERLRRLLVEDERVEKDTVRVRFVGFGPHSLNLEVVAYVLTSEHAEFLAVREDLFLQMMDVVAAAGSGFAFPSQTLYLGQDPGVDADAAARIAARAGTGSA